MGKHIGLVALAASLLIGSSCPPEQGGDPDPDNTLLPRTWSQIHSDNANSGFNAVHSGPTLFALRKWSASVGPLAFSTPVIGPDGVLYIGNRNGELVAIDPGGAELWRKKLGTTILSSAAVNNATNEVFVLAQEAPPPGSNALISRLFRVQSSPAAIVAEGRTISGIGGIGGAVPLQGEVLAVATQTVATSAAPKLLGNHVFLAQPGGRLFVFDQTSLQVVGSVDDGNLCFNLVCGSGPNLFGFIDDILDFFANCVNPAAPPDACVGEVRPPGGRALLDPSVAIVTAPNLVPDPNRPTIVVASARCVYAYRFHPAGDAPPAPGRDPHFELLWTRPLVPVDCDFKTTRPTTPVVLAGGTVVLTIPFREIEDEFGPGFHQMLAFDLLNGQELWRSSTLNAQVPIPPVADIAQIYAVLDGGVFVINPSNGQVVNSSQLLPGKSHGAALGLDHLYVTTAVGVSSFRLPLPADQLGEQAFDLLSFGADTVGRSSVILGQDDTVYAVSQEGLLVAYGPPPLGTAFVLPGVSFQTPVEDGTLSSVPGQSLVVNLTGGGGAGFNGTVTFVSDVEGTLCEAIPAGATATCVTSQALTPGPHQLSALATDASGASFSATISVQVVSPLPPNTPPSVSITSPAAGAVFAHEASTTFTATVSDPDQASFLASQVQWQSSIDGNIGTGLTFTRALSRGTHSITVTATDDQGATGSASVSVVVDTPPTVTITEPADGAILFSGTLIPFSATVSDLEEPVFPASGIRWTSSLDGELGTGASITSGLSNGTHTITVTATDTPGLSTQASIQVTVQPPVQ